MRPITGLPQVNLQLSKVEPGALRSLIAVRVQQQLMLPSLCELVFADPPGILPETIEQGHPVRLSVQGNDDSLFVGEVTALEYVYGPSGERELRVRAYDALYRLRKHQSVRTHVNVTAADLAREYTVDLGLGVQVDAAVPLWEWLLQHHQTDLEFLVQACEQAGVVFYLHDGILWLMTLDGVGSPVPLTLGSTLLEAKFDLNSLFAYDGVGISGWYPPNFTRHSSSDLNGGGRSIYYRVNEIVADSEQAHVFAVGQLRRQHATERTMWGVAEGNPALHPGARITVDNVASHLSVAYMLAAVVHTIDSRRGFISEFDTQPPAPSPTEDQVVATLGVVSNINGIDGRIRVELSALEANNPIETDWLTVVTPGAGADKGIIALPEVGDTVLVLLVQSFPGHGVVLGSVYSAGSLPDDGLVGGKRRRFTMRTSGGQVIQLDDSSGRIRLMNRDGSELDLSPGKVSLFADTDLEIAAPGRKITIRGHQIDFEQG
jgi:phage baseplate assembly protein gpV